MKLVAVTFILVFLFVSQSRGAWIGPCSGLFKDQLHLDYVGSQTKKNSNDQLETLDGQYVVLLRPTAQKLIGYFPFLAEASHASLLRQVLSYTMSDQVVIALTKTDGFEGVVSSARE